MKKFLVFFLACCMLLPVFVGCNNSGTADNTTTTTPAEETTAEETTAEETTTEEVTEPVEPEEEKLVLIENGATTYTLVHSQTATHYVTEPLAEFISAVNTKFGVTLTDSDDVVENLGEGQFYESDATEILVGATNRKESQEVLATLKENEYTVCLVNNKLVIVGYNDYLTSLALKDFVANEIETATDKLAINPNFSFVSKNTVSTIGDSDATLRIMTLNIRGKEDAYLSRVPLIQGVLNKYKPDVVCFQECPKEMHNNMLRYLTDYGIAMQTHAGSTTYIYTPILYRKDKLELVEAGSEWLDSRYTKTNTKALAWAVLKDKNTNDIFGVVNIHGSLWSTGYDLPEGKTHEDMFAIADTEWKADNIRQMNDRMNAIKEKHGDIAVLWTGDFNFANDHAAFTKAIEEYLMIDSEASATDSTDPNIKTYHPTGVRNEPEEGGSIDHILGNAKVTFRAHNVCNETDDEVKCSDHYAVYADVKFN